MYVYVPVLLYEDINNRKIETYTEKIKYCLFPKKQQGQRWTTMTTKREEKLKCLINACLYNHIINLYTYINYKNRKYKKKIIQYIYIYMYVHNYCKQLLANI